MTTYQVYINQDPAALLCGSNTTYKPHPEMLNLVGEIDASDREDAFEKLNNAGCLLRSFSVGDILLELNGKTYLCCDIGWREI